METNPYDGQSVDKKIILVMTHYALTVAGVALLCAAGYGFYDRLLRSKARAR